MENDGLFPYAGTSGWSGTDTSRERVEREDSTGKTSERRKEVLLMVSKSQAYGLTVKELREKSGWHHGQASGALSVLHRTGHLAMINEKRNGCHIYVLPECAAGKSVILPLGTRRNPEKIILDKVLKLHAREILNEWLFEREIEMETIRCAHCKTPFPCETRQIIQQEQL